MRGERGAYVFRVATGTSDPIAADAIATSYQWLDGILLTEDDLNLVDMNNAGPFRGARKEFVAASVTRPLRELSLSVTFPSGFRPEEENVDVYHQRIPAGAAVKDQALRQRVQFMAQAIILTVPYPLMEYRYVIAWKPVAAAPVRSAARAFQQRCATTDFGNDLVRSFISGIKNAVWSKSCSVALYVEEPDTETRGRFLRRVGLANGVSVAEPLLEPPPVNVDMRTQRGLYLHSWWGDDGIAVCVPEEFDERAKAEGVLAEEFVTATMPFRGLGEIDGKPWGILRIGIFEDVPDVRPGGDLHAFRNFLARGTLEMLSTISDQVG